MKKIRSSESKISDVLNQAASKAKLDENAIISVRSWLAELLVAQEHAKLGQGGHTENHIPLRRVFVDLPVIDNPNQEYPFSSRVLFLGKMLSSEPIRLRQAFRLQSALLEDEEQGEDSETDEGGDAIRGEWKHSFNAALLIGGPGQGKSTIGQLACQLNRASLLKPFEPLLSASHRDLVNSFENIAATQGALDLPKKPSLPIQISLPDFTAWATNEKIVTTGKALPLLLRFVADLASAKKHSLTADHLMALAAHIPLLIVLDGFDEVGAAKDRTRLVAAAREFLTALAEINATAHVIATTRPQGYAGELAQIGVSLKTCYLAPLLKDEALEYAQKLVEAKLPSADDRIVMLNRLSEASRESATERLLTTPLQVTIMTALVQQLGRAPRERWNLFSRYFSYSYDREIERNSFASRLLADYRTHIEQIHVRVALILQVDAERTGGAAARMARAQLESIIDAVLSEDGFTEEDRKSLVNEIAIAAEQRLVFLVEPEPGKFGFEIRSLQEFMAARAITSGREVDVEARLQQIADAPMFRNVLLFIVSRLYSEGSPLREMIAEQICGRLDSDVNDLESHLTKAGSLLALETLEEGAVLSHPKRARDLMERAINLLALPPAAEHLRLGRVTNTATTPVLKDAIEECLSKSNPSVLFNENAAWACLISAINRGDQWAIELGDKYWTRFADHAPALLRVFNLLRVPLGSWLSYRIIDVADKVSLDMFVNMPAPAATLTSFDNWTNYFSAVFNRDNQWKLKRRGNRYINLVIPRSATGYEKLGALPALWRPWQAIAQFELGPNAHTLAAALNAIADCRDISPFKLSTLTFLYSWPLLACLMRAESADELRKFSVLAQEGTLGDTSIWVEVQKKWLGKIDFSSLVDSLEQDIPWNLTALKKSPPFLAMPFWAFRESSNAKAAITLNKAIEKFSASQNSAVRESLAELCLTLIRHLPRNTARDKNEVDMFLTSDMPSENIAFIVPRPSWMKSEDWIRRLDASRAPSRYSGIYFSSAVIMKALHESGGHLVVLRLVVQNIEIQEDRFGFDEGLWDQISDQIEKASEANPDALVDCRLMQIFFNRLSVEQEKTLVTDIARVAEHKPRVWNTLLIFLDIGQLPYSRAANILTEVSSVIGMNHMHSGLVIKSLRKVLQNRLSELDNNAIWNRLAFPLPHPGSSEISENYSAIRTTPVLLESLEFKNIRGLENIKFELRSKPSEGGQWTVLLGPNGIGKTTILRAIALSLRNARDLAIWPKGVFSSGWQRIAAGGNDSISDAEVKIKISGGQEHSTAIRSETSVTIIQSPAYSLPRLFPLFAYGCRRGSALGGATRKVDLNDEDGPEIATLFDDRADLIHAETWLISLEGDVAKNPRSRNVYHAVIAALTALLDIENIEVLDRKVWVTLKNQPRLPFSALSDGYLTSMGWFLDLLARWLHLAEQSETEIQENFLEKMCGLVLIDEIDLHLHPLWQIEIISRTKKLLPNMSFIVTTHNPLTLVGAKAEEIWVLSSEDNKVQIASGTEAPVLLTSGQIYRRYFGIEDIYPDGLGKALQRYSFLCGYAYRSVAEQEELIVLRDKLSAAGFEPNWEIVSQEGIKND